MCCLAAGGLCLGGLDVDEFATVATFGKFYGAANECIKGVVLTDTYIEAGVMHGAALTLDDVAGFGELTAENFHAEAFAF